MKTKRFLRKWQTRVCFPYPMVAGVLSFLVFVVMQGDPVYADLKLCNKTQSRIGVALGYKGELDWISEGWWEIDPDSCAVLLKGDLASRYYYIHAVDYDEGGEWSGNKYYMCTQDRAFSISGTENCTKRKFQRTGFMEIDTKNERDWTVKLTPPNSSRESAE